MPEELVIYFGDQRTHSLWSAARWGKSKISLKPSRASCLIKGAKIIVVACNAASAAALTYLRQTFSDVSFVGMEPAVKPAAEHTETGVVGVLATPATFQGALYASVVERFANGVELLQDPCVGLVQQIEKGDLYGTATRKILEDALHPMLEKNIDTVVLGLYSLSVCDSAHSGDRRGKGSGD